MAYIGYRRVSTAGQNTERQLDGITLDRLFEDHISGSAKTRPGLDECLRYLREGDTLVVHSIDRLARNLRHLRELLDELLERGVSVRFVKENMTFEAGTRANPMQALMLNMMGSFAEFERALILERQAEGIAKAKAKGRYKGRKPSLTASQIEEIRTRRESEKVTVKALAAEYGVSRPTLYAALK